MMDSEGGEVLPHPPKHYSRKGKWSVYSSSHGGRSPSKSREPNRVLSEKAQARREKEYELGTKVGGWVGGRWDLLPFDCNPQNNRPGLDGREAYVNIGEIRTSTTMYVSSPCPLSSSS